MPDKTTISSTNKIRANRLASYLNHLGYIPGVNQGIPDTSNKDAKTFSLFPAPTTAAPGTIKRSNALMEFSNGRGTISMTRDTKDENGAWLFDTKTLSDQNMQILQEADLALINSDPDLQKSVAASSVEGWILVNTPASLRKQFLFVMYWQWLALGILVFLGLLTDLIFRLFFRSFLRRWVGRALTHLTEKPDDTILRRAVRACGILVATIIWRVGIELLFLPIEVLDILLVVTNIMLVLAAIIAGFKLADFFGAIFSHRAKTTENKLDDLIIPLITKSVKIVVVIIGFIYFAQAIDVKISPLLAGLGIGGIGFAFAAQNSIENFFGSITVLLDRPFQVGDWVVIDEVEGTVIAVGMRSSRVRTFYDSVVTLPNSILVNNKVNNYGMRSYRRWTTKLELLYETTPEQIEAYCEGARQLVREHPYTRKDYYQVFLNEFGASGIQILVYVFWEAPDWQTELRERHRFMLDLMRLAKELDVSFAYPTQTVYLARSPRIAEMPEGLMQGQDKLHNEKYGRDTARKVTESAPWVGKKPDAYAFRSSEEMLDADKNDTPLSSPPETNGESMGSAGE
jgi:MscS family membrane protein